MDILLPNNVNVGVHECTKIRLINNNRSDRTMFSGWNGISEELATLKVVVFIVFFL